MITPDSSSTNTSKTGIGTSEFQRISNLSDWLGQQIIGQSHLVQRMLIGLLANGHLLVEGAPGLAKTKAIKTLAEGIEGDFHRIQFTPDLLPSDVTGTDIYRPENGSFEFQSGPIFNNLVLADEINRAPAKVQSALLEAMGESQVSIGRKTYKLPKLFMVMATQNPIEQEGTYPLPEAQLDRFLMHVQVGYPNIEAEQKILRLARNEARDIEAEQPEVVSEQDIFNARKQILSLHMADSVENYIVHLIDASRHPESLGSESDSNPHSSTNTKTRAELAQWIEFGASPRGTIALDRCARAHAWLNGKDFVSPDDVQAVIHDTLRHRLLLSFEAEAAGITTDQVIDRLLTQVSAV